jgi:transposase
MDKAGYVTATRIHCETNRIICGVDVSSQTLDVRIGRDGASASFSNDGEGIQSLAEFSRKHEAAMVVMEASGGYEQLSFGVLSSMGIEVAVVNARSVRRFAQAMDIFEKTDRIDAGVIAWYGETKKVMATRPATSDQRRLKALVTRLRQLTEMRASQRNQGLLVSEAGVRKLFRNLLLLINQQIGELETEIAALIRADPLWQQLDRSFRTIKGVADRTVARLMAELPEIGLLSNKKISKLGGIGASGRRQRQIQGQTNHLRGTPRRARHLVFHCWRCGQA